MRARLYIDGYNLYYGALKGRPYKWLDLEQWSARLLPGHSIDRIHYFTARVTARPNDPQVATRQDAYLRALATLPSVRVTEGQFKLSQKRMFKLHDATHVCCTSTPPCQCACCSSPFALVQKSEEKGSDVNLAVQMLRDGFMNRYDLAAVVSDDSDIQGACDIVRSELRKRVVVVSPRNYRHAPLRGDEKRQTRPGALAACQLPNPVMGTNGMAIHKPAGW